MEDYHSSRIVDHDELDGLSLPGEVQLALDDLAGSVREGLLALSVGVGLRVMDELVEEEPRARRPEGQARSRAHRDPARLAARPGRARRAQGAGAPSARSLARGA